MNDDTSATPTRKRRKRFIQLPSALAQLVNDRFDEDQYDQAVDLLEQLKAQGVTPPKSLVQKLVTLSLCSLAPGQLASSSRWTLDHQLRDISAQLLTQHKGGKGDQNVMKAASSASDKPSSSAVLRASSLLLRYSYLHSDTTGVETEAPADVDRETCLLSRNILESLPSQRKPLERTRSVSPESSRRTRRGSARLDDDDHDGSFDVSCIERWVRNKLQGAEDVWDLLCGRDFSSTSEAQDLSFGRVGEFWMNDAERKRYEKQRQSSSTSHQRLEDKLKQIRRKKLNGARSSESSGTDGDESSDDDDELDLKISLPDGGAKRTAKSKSKGKIASRSEKPAKRRRIAKTEASSVHDETAQNSGIRMTEGAWRTLAVLLRLWDQATPRNDDTNADITSGNDNEPALLWQFPRSHSARQNGRCTIRSASGNDTTDDIGRALDVAFSFPRVLPAYTAFSTGNEAVTNLFDTTKSTEARGEARLFSSVPQAELMHRQEVGNQKDDHFMALRARIAARLLSSIFALVQLGHISSGAFTEGVSDRIEALQGEEVQALMLQLLELQPFVVVNTLDSYLTDTTRTRPDKEKSPDPVQFSFEHQGTSTMDATLAYAMPREQAALPLLKNRSTRQQDSDAKAILNYLSLHKLELDDSANTSLSVTFPDRSESRKQPVVQKQNRRQNNSDQTARRLGRLAITIKKPDSEAEAPLTEDMKKGGLVAFAFVRMVQMQARHRINLMKFFIAQAIYKMQEGDQAERREQTPCASTNGSAADLEQTDSQSSRAEWMSQRRNLKLYLTRLYKAIEHDSSDFRGCVMAMRTHLSKISVHRSRQYFADLLENGGPRDGLAALPTLEMVVERCSESLNATQEMAAATRLMMDSIK